MKALPKISESEWRVMEILWESNPLTAAEIIDKLDNSLWNEKTIRTFLNRLVSKKVIGHSKTERVYRYYPLVSKQECAEAESENFLTKVYNGSLHLMVANFIQKEKLTSEEIAELRALLEEER